MQIIGFGFIMRFIDPILHCTARVQSLGPGLQLYHLRMDSNALFMQFTAELVSSPIHRDRAAAFDLFRDWTFARARLWAEITTKLFYFRQLPWKILAMAHPVHELAVLGAQECLQLYDNDSLVTSGREHRQSQRFLSQDFEGDHAGDISLRPYVERLAKGEPLSELKGPFTAWLGRLASIRVSERSVEGTHSLVTKVYRRAPAASLSYVSVELRLPDVVKTLTCNPRAPGTQICKQTPG